MLTKSALAVPVIVATALIMSACTTDAGGEAVDGTGVNDACVATVTDYVNQEREELELLLPESSFDVADVQGKSVWIINVLTNQFIGSSNEGYQAAADAAGVDLTIFDGQGNANTWNEGMQQAIAQGADGIILFGIDSSIVSEAVKEATAAGITVVESLAVNYDAERMPELFANLSADYYKDGATLANWTLADSDCTANTYVMYSSGLPIWVDTRDGAFDAFAENCPECTISDENVDLANVATELPRLAQTKLAQSPETGYILATWDSALPFIESAAIQVNPDVALLGRDGIDEALNEIRSGGMTKVTVASPPPQWIAWTAFDNVLRGIAGQEPNGLQVPTRLIDATNVGAANSDVMSNYIDFGAAFAKVWGE